VQNGAFAKAAKWCREVLSSDAANVRNDARLGLADAMYRLGELEESKRELARLLESNPEDGLRSDATLLLGRIHFDAGAFAKARETFEMVRELGNATILVSIEGNEVVSNERRGGKDVYERTLRGLDNCLKHKILTGVATSLCQTNIDELLTEEWLRSLIDRGVHYAWYHTYRPVGPQIHEELALTHEQARRLHPRWPCRMRQGNAPLAIGMDETRPSRHVR